MTQPHLITGTSKLAGVMGWPVAHSRSPLLHNYWLRTYGLEGIYVPLAVAPADLERALRGLSALGFRGCNITVPHKENALALMDEVEPLAKMVGAINTVVVGENGKLIGSNTDVYGFTANLETVGKAWDRKKPALVVGAGGASRAVIIALASVGCSEIRLCNRTNDRAIALAHEMRQAITSISLPFMARPSNITVIAWQDRHDALHDCALLVNTTTQGMQGQPALDMDLRELNKDALVTDLVYTPLITPLLAQARRRGHTVVDGLGMLLNQAVPGFHAWYGQRPQVDDAVRHLLVEDITRAISLMASA